MTNQILDTWAYKEIYNSECTLNTVLFRKNTEFYVHENN